MLHTITYPHTYNHYIPFHSVPLHYICVGALWAYLRNFESWKNAACNAKKRDLKNANKKQLQKENAKKKGIINAQKKQMQKRNAKQIEGKKYIL